MLGKPELFQSLISAGAALLGTIIGGAITWRFQTQQRRIDFQKEQLREFYAPLQSIRVEIEIKGAMFDRVNKALNETWMETFGEIKDVDEKEKARQVHGPTFENARLSEERRVREIIDLYTTMLERMKARLWLAEPSTINFYPVLVDLVEVWRRSDLQTSGAFSKLESHGSKLNAFYEDIEQNFNRLTGQAKHRKSGRFLARKQEKTAVP
jgi:hypothetical protein